MKVSIFKYLFNGALLVITAGCASQHVVSYDSYDGLVMAGYQGWFNAEGDGENRGFYHYTGPDGFKPGSATIDMWPEVAEYEKIYPTEFTMPDGSPAMVFSSADSTTVDTHFKWMKDYGLDGVFMQRFVSEIKSDGSRAHFNGVLDNAMACSKRYGRAIAVMYDLSGMNSSDVALVVDDLKELDNKYDISGRDKYPNYLFHNGKPLVAVWGVGFNDGRRYGIDDADRLISSLSDMGFSIMIGVPTNWRTLDGDTDNDPALHDLIRKCDIVMPWFVGRYDSTKYASFIPLITEDMKWCDSHGVDYAPLVYPGFAWRNMNGKDSFFVPRESGTFFQKQIDSALDLGAKMLYVAMFDEIDEGTAIFKCSHTVPVSENGTEFIPVDRDVPSDHYLRIAGAASSRLKNDLRKRK